MKKFFGILIGFTCIGLVGLMQVTADEKKPANNSDTTDTKANQPLATDIISNGGVKSLRGKPQLHATPEAEELKHVQRDQSPIIRDYLHQPPLIPHQIRNYTIDTKSNKCLSCHSWKNYKQSGATKISFTHYDTRDGLQLSDVSPRRYFCTQCHVTQADAKPLIGNEFNPVEEISGN